MLNRMRVPMDLTVTGTNKEACTPPSLTSGISTTSGGLASLGHLPHFTKAMNKAYTLAQDRGNPLRPAPSDYS